MTVQQSAFKRAGQKKREEARGAEEVQEDENTATELPVDQVSLDHLWDTFVFKMLRTM